MVADIFIKDEELSKMKNKWFGLILPILSFIYSLFLVLGIVTFEAMGKG